ncbi:hypothetical protein NVIRENTERO_00474 [Sodalis praecaptivus]|nr:hypothetical protein NVIRENTERO_00474 [Sodalis praecaptivus]
MCKKTAKMTLLLMFWAIALLMSASNAYALSCHQSSTGSVSDTEALGVFAYLAGSDNGQVVWRSQSFTRTITCKSELAANEADQESVNVYPFPKRAEQTFPAGVKMGLIFNGKDIGVFSTAGDVNAGRVDTGYVVKKNSTKEFTATFQAYLLKDGEIKTAGVDDVTLFQLDGVKGINQAANKNYNLSITGWENIGSVRCNPTLEKKSTQLPSIDTDKALTGGATANITAATLSISCSSDTPDILQHLRAISGTLKATGTAFSGNSDYFATDKTGLGVGVSYGGSTLKPAGTLTLSVTVTGASGSMALPLTLKPHLTTSLSLGTPAWVFSDQASNITSAMQLTFTPELVKTNLGDNVTFASTFAGAAGTFNAVFTAARHSR